VQQMEDGVRSDGELRSRSARRTYADVAPERLNAAPERNALARIYDERVHGRRGRRWPDCGGRFRY
jgi:hypothetical protein